MWTACRWRPPTTSSAPIPTGWPCGWPRVASTSPAVSASAAIARAVIRRPAIYVFDDALSALDVHTDARVRAALHDVSADATVIIVAQRVSTVSRADHIVVLDEGRMVGRGAHEQLIGHCPVYAELVDSQYVDAGGPR